MAQVDIQINADLLSFVKTPEFLYGERENYDGTSIGIPIGLPTIKKYDFTHEGHTASVYQHCLTFAKAVFGESFGSNHPAYENFAYVTYEGDNMRVFSKPVIVKHDDGLTLLMGSQSKDDGREYVKNPLVSREGKITLKDSAIARLSLTSIDIPKQGSTTEKIKLPIACFRANNTVYSIAVRTPQDSDFFELQDSWTDADIDRLQDLIAPLYGASANLSNMFAKLLVSKKFPSKGVVIKVISAKKQTIESKKEGDNKKFEKVVLTVDCSDLPTIPVTAYSDGQEQTVSLQNVTQISCYTNHTAAVPVLQGKTATPSEPWYLWVEKAGNNPNQVPVHQIYTGFVPPRIKATLEAMKQPGYFTLSPSAASDTPNYDDNPL